MIKAKKRPGNRMVGKACGLCLALTAYSAEGLAATYYIAPNGNDSNPGTIASPWATIAKANTSLAAGDTVYLRAGTYGDTIEPINSGQVGRAITYKSYPNETVAVTGAYSGSPVVSIDSNVNYITVDGLNLRQTHPTGTTYEIALNGSYSVIRNCRIVSTSDPVALNTSGTIEQAILLAGSDNLIESNHIEGMSGGGIKLQGVPRFNIIRNNTIINNFGDAIRVDSAKGVLMGTLIEGNRLAGSLVSDGVQFNGDWSLSGTAHALDTSNRGTIIRDNWIYDNAENGIDLKGTSNIVIERNYVFGNVGDNNGSIVDVADRNGGKGIHKGGNNSSKDVIIRNNFVYSNSSGVILLDHYMIYNNDILFNNRDYTGADSTFYDRDKPVFTNIAGTSAARAAIKNNIIGQANSAEIGLLSSTNADIDNNLYFNSNTVTMSMDIVPWKHLTFGDWLNTLAGMSNIVGKDRNSRVVADPMFINVPARPVSAPDKLDFRLAGGSPAIDAGTNLTNTAGSGTGTNVALKDAGYFMDGFGVTAGDSIRIGSNSPVTITAVDYSTNTVTIDRSISWANNAPVSLSYSGSAPDIGALEYVAQSVPSTPTGLQVTVSAQ